MRFFYSIIVFIVSLILFPVFLFHPRGKIRLRERYGFWEKLSVNEFVWFHGSSIGEVQGLQPIMRLWKERFPQDKIILTVTSPTGLTVKENLADYSFLMPYDCTLYFCSIFSRYKIKRFIFGETELWPNLLARFSNEGIPVHLVNGVLSDDSYAWYQKIERLITPLMKKINTISVADKVSMERFLSLGALSSSIALHGNAKYEKEVKAYSFEERVELKKQFFNNDFPVLTLGSIHPGEELYWFKKIREIFDTKKQLNVVIAPRHLEKISYFESQLAKYNLSYYHRSKSNQNAFSICLLDTFGELSTVYAFSNSAFVGGTLVKVGGHNPIEPAAYSCVPIIGPQNYKIKPLTEDLDRANGVVRVHSEEDVRLFIDDFILRQDYYKKMGKSAFSVWKDYQGASKRIFEYML